MDTTDTMREEIEMLKTNIAEQQEYFYANLKKPLMRKADEVFAIKSSIPSSWRVKHEQVKIIFTRFRRKLGRAKRRKAYINIEIKYRYRTVLEFMYQEPGTAINLKTFHACEWLNVFPTLMEKVSETLLKESQKKELKWLKGNMRSLKKRCSDFTPLCENGGE